MNSNTIRYLLAPTILLAAMWQGSKDLSGQHAGCACAVAAAWLRCHRDQQTVANPPLRCARTREIAPRKTTTAAGRAAARSQAATRGGTVLPPCPLPCSPKAPPPTKNQGTMRLRPRCAIWRCDRPGNCETSGLPEIVRAHQTASESLKVKRPCTQAGQDEATAEQLECFHPKPEPPLHASKSKSSAAQGA